MNNPFPGTRAEFDQENADGTYNCPDCGLRLTQPYPGCHCPGVITGNGFVATRHINKYHHNCNDAWKRAYSDRRVR